MKIDEAIRVQTVLKGAPVLKDDQRIVDALRLGIAALKEIEAARSYSVGLIPELLPGETKD